MVTCAGWATHPQCHSSSHSELPQPRHIVVHLPWPMILGSPTSFTSRPPFFSAKYARYLGPKRLNIQSGILRTSWYALVGVPVLPAPLTRSRSTHISRTF